MKFKTKTWRMVHFYVKVLKPVSITIFLCIPAWGWVSHQSHWKVKSKSFCRCRGDYLLSISAVIIIHSKFDNQEGCKLKLSKDVQKIFWSGILTPENSLTSKRNGSASEWLHMSNDWQARFQNQEWDKSNVPRATLTKKTIFLSYSESPL